MEGEDHLEVVKLHEYRLSLSIVAPYVDEENEEETFMSIGVDFGTT